MTTGEKYKKLTDILKAYGSIAVAFSAGVDSTFLLYAAKQALGEKVIAVTAVSPVIPQSEQKDAEKFCAEHAIRLIKADTAYVLDLIKNNPENRCYICKKQIMGVIKAAAAKEGFFTVAEGSNLDDRGDYRPGMKAVKELGVISPLLEAGLTKAEIRALSKAAGLNVWNKPAYACLATRFAVGDTVTESKLRAVETAEEYLHEKGFLQVRVRVHGNLARIEVLPEDIEKICSFALRKDINEKLLSLGFSYVSLDMGGYKTGNMNKH